MSFGINHPEICTILVPRRFSGFRRFHLNLGLFRGIQEVLNVVSKGGRRFPVSPKWVSKNLRGFHGSLGVLVESLGEDNWGLRSLQRDVKAFQGFSVGVKGFRRYQQRIRKVWFQGDFKAFHLVAIGSGKFMGLSRVSGGSRKFLGTFTEFFGNFRWYHGVSKDFRRV